MKTAFRFLSLWVALSVRAGEEVVVLRSAPVPNRLLRQGDALLIRNGELFGVRIDLNTRHLRKVRSKILQSEQQNWPDHPGSLQYRNALITITDTLLKQNGKVTFRIDWFLKPDGSGIVTVGNETGHQKLETLPADYLKDNLLLILQDRFDLTAEEAEAEFDKLKHNGEGSNQ